MSTDSKSKPIANTSQETTNPEPPPPYFPSEQGGGGSSDTTPTRGYGGGANEQTPFLQGEYPRTPNLQYGEMPQAQPNEAVPLALLTIKPQMTTCPHCNHITLSNAEYKSGSCTWLSCMTLFCLIGTSICSFVPFLINKSKDVNHSCSRCGKLMATYSRLKGKAVLK